MSLRFKQDVIKGIDSSISSFGAVQAAVVWVIGNLLEAICVYPFIWRPRERHDKGK